MLLNITINDLAVVDSLDLNLHGGMSVLTGETGAGKSILLTALGLALGERADSGFIRPGCKRAEVSIEFDLDDAPAAADWLQENDLDDEQHCLVRRVVNQDGRSKAYINNRPVTLQSLQALSSQLVEIHGQHAHLTLLNSDQQRQQLDGFANTTNDVAELNSVFLAWKKARQEWQTLQQASQNQTEREELIRYQLDELQQLDLDNYNYDELSQQHHTLANLGKILQEGQQQMDVLYDNDQHSISQMVSQSSQALVELGQYANELCEIAEILSEAQIQIDEASQQLRRFLDSQEVDPHRLNELDEQLGIIHNLSRKHQCEPSQLPHIAQQLTDELNTLTHSSDRIDELEQTCRQWLQHYNQQATALSKTRQQKGQQLAKRISAMIKELGMPNGEFLVNVEPQPAQTPSLHGIDQIEYLVSANPGLPPKPLNKVASGGELSRISLAIQVTTSSDKSTPTMIFDEVDAGIGGGIAEIVGQKMRTLSEGRQVMCVTHLPQVAAQAHQHLFVSKTSQSDEMTSSSVTHLAQDERIQEIARMLGGVEITENTLAHAEEMLIKGNPDT